MANSNADVYLTAPEGSAPILMRRVTGNTGAIITQSDIDSATYSIFLLDDQDADSRTAVASHSDVGLTIANVIEHRVIFDNSQLERHPLPGGAFQHH